MSDPGIIAAAKAGLSGVSQSLVWKCIHFVAEFFEQQDGGSSMSRLLAFLAGAVGCGCAIATMVFAFKHPDQAASTAALTALTTALVGGGAAAIITRNSGTTTGGT